MTDKAPETLPAQLKIVAEIEVIKAEDLPEEERS